MNENKLVTQSSMNGFFLQEIESAVDKQGVKISEHSKSYVVNVLSDYTHAHKLHAPNSETLAMLYLRSQQVGGEERIQTLKRLGDMALCISGFFADSLNRKIVDVDYYISMGGSAYGSLATMYEAKREAAVFGVMYAELARKFAKLVEVLNEVSEGLSGADQSMLRLYDRWLKTGSDRMHRILVEKGVIPNRTVKRNLQ